MTSEDHCPKCGAILSDETPDGLCPRCLMGIAAEAEDEDLTVRHISSPIEAVGTVIGPYKLLEKIGEGGMAVVYMADQERPFRRRVALKIIKLGMDTKRVVARFEAERQALAMMDHPNIAKVLDAGTTQAGRPYFVMELVRGVSITEYCDTNKLSTQERLDLFIAVCNAVHHAHQKGIIHRDIKPSNIMVTLHDGKSVPKVIDFGIAKAINQRLTEHTLFTRYSEMIGTPEYMSPEQAEMSGLDIDTRTDIYSLGAVLYELLTGVLPFDPVSLRSASYEEIQRIIREEEPLTPSTRLSALGQEAGKIAESRGTDIVALTKRLHSELEWIPLMAMRKDRTHRYSSAYEFGHDIGNYLQGLPLIAGPESVLYRVRKVLQKHRLAVLTTTVVAATLLVGFVVSTYLYVRVRQARNAVSRLEKVVEADRSLSMVQNLYAEGRYKAALGEMERYFERNGRDDKAILLYAHLLYSLDRFGEAEAELTRLLESPPQIAGPAHCLLATIYMGSNPGKAEVHQEAGESLLPRTAEAYTLRGITADGSMSTIEWLSKALELDPAYYPARKGRALASYAVRNYATMATDAEAMVVMRPKDALGYALRAIARREAGQCDMAMEDHNRAISLCDSPDELPELHDQRRRTLTQMREYQAALRDAQHCVRLRPDNLYSGFELFVALVLAGDYPGAKDQHTQLAGHPRYRDREFRIWISRNAFRLLVSGHSLDFPADIIREEPFSMLRKAIDQYRVCQSFGTCLIPSAFGVPAWSPDGKELTYGRIDRYAMSRGFSTSGAPLVYESGGLEALNLESGRIRIIAPSGKGSAWSPDGRWIAFDRAPDRGPAGCASELWIIPSSGGRPRYLAHGGWPIWTRQAGRLFYQSAGAACSINAGDPPGTPQAVLSCPPYFAVSPDARYLAYSDAGRLSVVEISSGAVKATWTAPPPEGQRGIVLNWAPNGKEILAGGVHEAELGLWSFDIEQGKAWQLFPSPAVLGSVSPDNSKIAIEIRDWFGGIWLAELDPADSIHEGVRSALTEDQYLRRSCREFAEAIRRGTYRADAYTHLRSFIARAGALADIYYRKGQYDDALDTFQGLEELCKALDRQPNDSAVAVAAMSLHRLGREQDAEAALELLRRLSASEADRLQMNLLYEVEKVLAGEDTEIGRLWRCLEQARIDEAAHWLLETQAGDDVGKVRNAAGEAFYQRGRGCNHRGGDYDNAMRDYATAVQLDPRHARARCDLAWLQVACPVAGLRDKDQAVANATRACELTNWGDHRCLATLAAVYAQVGDFAVAVSWQRKAIELLTGEEKSCWRGDYESRLSLYASGEPYTQGSLWSFSTGRMVGWWKFDEISGGTVNDSSGNQCTGTVVGVPKWEQSGGKIGGALAFDGSRVEVGPERLFDITDAITVTAWVKVNAFDKWWQALITKGDSSWRLYREGDSDNLAFHCDGVRSAQEPWTTVRGQMNVNDGKWHHVAGVYDGWRIALFVDGQLDASCEASGQIQTNNYPVVIGDNAEAPGRQWSGLIDDVRIYSYALNPDEIMALHAMAAEASSQ